MSELLFPLEIHLEPTEIRLFVKKKKTQKKMDDQASTEYDE